MSNKNLHQESNNTMERKNQAPLDTAKSDNVSREPIVQNTSEKKGKKLTDKRLKRTGLIMMGIFVAAMFVTSTLHSSKSVDVSEAAALAIKQQTSTTLPIGTRLMSDDQSLAGQNLTITHTSNTDKTKIYIWDYAAEDGDYVQVFVDGVALGDPFMIKNKPINFEVPTTGEIHVLGTRDGGGGITYAIHYDLNGTTYFNGMSAGDGNLYTLIRE